MPPERSEAARLWVMLDAARALQEFVRGRTYEDFSSRPLSASRGERCGEVIGEAASHVGEPFREAHPEIPWVKIIVTRHRFVHEYFGLDPVIVWRIATTHVPELVVGLSSLNLQPPPDAHGP